MENQTQTNQPKKTTQLIYNLVMFIIGISLGSILFLHCEGKKNSNTGNELQEKYNNLELQYISLQNAKAKIDYKLKAAEAKLISVKEDHKKELIAYGKTYAKGRDIIINNPCKDSLHLAAYDSLNASCQRTQASADIVQKQSNWLIGEMQVKINNLDSTVNNRNYVISLDKITISATRDTLSNERKINKRKPIKAFFIGFGAGVAAKTTIDAIMVLKK